MWWEKPFLPFPNLLHVLVSCTYLSDIDSSCSQIWAGAGRIQVRVNNKLFLQPAGKLWSTSPSAFQVFDAGWQLMCFESGRTLGIVLLPPVLDVVRLNHRV